jgi:hypothetical protein
MSSRQAYRGHINRFAGGQDLFFESLKDGPGFMDSIKRPRVDMEMQIYQSVAAKVCGLVMDSVELDVHGADDGGGRRQLGEPAWAGVAGRRARKHVLVVVLSFAARSITGGGVVESIGKEVCSAGDTARIDWEELRQVYAHVSVLTRVKAISDR